MIIIIFNKLPQEIDMGEAANKCSFYVGNERFDDAILEIRGHNQVVITTRDGQTRLAHIKEIRQNPRPRA